MGMLIFIVIYNSNIKIEFWYQSFIAWGHLEVSPLSRNLLWGVGADVLQSPEDMFWGWWCSWQMGTLGLESVFVGDVGDLNWGTVGWWVFEGSSDYDGFSLELALFLGGETVGGFVVEGVSFGVDVSGLAEDFGGSFICAITGGGAGNSHDGKKDYLRKKKLLPKSSCLITNSIITLFYFNCKSSKASFKII